MSTDDDDAAWSPPATPDPEQIFTEARLDVAEARYPVALAKLAWFHHNAVRIGGPRWYGVRLSYSLDAWARLAKLYPPALDRLRNVRSAAESDLRSGNEPTQAFIDCFAID